MALQGRGLRGIFDDADERAGAAEAAEHGGGLDELDMGVEVLGEAVAGGANEDVAVDGVLPDVVFLHGARHVTGSRARTLKQGNGTHGVEHRLGLAHGDVHLDPVLRRRVRARALGDAVPGEPFLHGGEALGAGRDEALDLFLGQVLAVARVVGVARLVQVCLKRVEVALRERDAQRDRVLRGGVGDADPVARDVDVLFELERAARGGGGEGGEGEQDGDGGEREHRRERGRCGRAGPCGPSDASRRVLLYTARPLQTAKHMDAGSLPRNTPAPFIASLATCSHPRSSVSPA